MNATFQVREPGVRKLEADLIRANRALICSERLKRCFQELNAARSEFFPIQAFLHQRQRVEKNYFLMHVGDRWPCLDYTASVFEDRGEFERANDIDAVVAMNSVVLDESLIPNDSRCFYIQNSPFPYLPVVRCAGGERLLMENWVGLEWVPVDEFSWDEFS